MMCLYIGTYMADSADHSGRTVQVVSRLRPLEPWDPGFEPTSGMDVCGRLLCVCAVLCTGSGLVKG
jgi:hypothetical protein